MKFDAEITGYELEPAGNFTCYLTRVRVDAGTEWTVKIRYRVFHEFYTQLVALVGAKKLKCEFPRKSGLFFTPKPEIRSKQLNEFLQHVIELYFQRGEPQEMTEMLNELLLLSVASKAKAKDLEEQEAAAESNQQEDACCCHHHDEQDHVHEVNKSCGAKEAQEAGEEPAEQAKEIKDATPDVPQEAPDASQANDINEAESFHKLPETKAEPLPQEEAPDEPTLEEKSKANGQPQVQEQQEEPTSENQLEEPSASSVAVEPEQAEAASKKEYEILPSEDEKEQFAETSDEDLTCSEAESIDQFTGVTGDLHFDNGLCKSVLVDQNTAKKKKKRLSAAQKQRKYQRRRERKKRAKKAAAEASAGQTAATS